MALSQAATDRRCLGAWVALPLALLVLASGAPADNPVPRTEYPVILVHGLRSDASTWDDFVAALTQTGWTFGQQMMYRDGSIRYLPGRFSGTLAPADIYTVTFSSNDNLTYVDQARELEAVINRILELRSRARITPDGLA